jgi:hypothetical protein
VPSILILNGIMMSAILLKLMSPYTNTEKFCGSTPSLIYCERGSSYGDSSIKLFFNSYVHLFTANHFNPSLIF